MQPSEMTNEKILSLAELCFFEDHSVEEDQQTAAVLRDYVRMRSEIAELRAKIKVAEDALTNSPCGVIYQLGISDDDGNFYDGVVIKFDEAEVLKMPRVRQGDKFRVLPLNALAAI